MYAGAVGYVGYSGVMDTAIAIRTLVVRGGTVHLQAGAGIVFDSVPRYEYDETISKLRATMRAVDAAVLAGEEAQARHDRQLGLQVAGAESPPPPRMGAPPAEAPATPSADVKRDAHGRGPVLISSVLQMPGVNS